MKGKLFILPIILCLGLLTACGEMVEVPPAHMGKILTKDGFKGDNVPPSKFRLEFCMAYCDELIVLEASDRGLKESMQLFMPKDQLNMAFDIRATVSIHNDPKTVNQIFNRVPAGDDQLITLSEVYSTYAEQKFRSTARSVLANYTINEVAANRAAVEQNLFNELAEALNKTPIKLTQLGLANVQFPEVIVKAKELAKEREVAIERAEAERAIAVKKAETALVVAQKDRLVRLEKAQTIKEENLLTAKSVTKEYLAYKKLEVLEAIARSGSAIYIPLDVDLTLVESGLFKK